MATATPQFQFNVHGLRVLGPFLLHVLPDAANACRYSRDWPMHVQVSKAKGEDKTLVIVMLVHLKHHRYYCQNTNPNAPVTDAAADYSGSR
jgi:hypothetical protein